MYKEGFELAHDFLQGKDSVEEKVLLGVQNLDYSEYIWEEFREAEREKEEVQREKEQTQDNRWYCFGQLSRRQKLWIMDKWLAKRLRLYPMLRALAALIRRHRIWPAI
ncbi:hypothetical protein P0082_11965 [Candidatus Haliotispira prima]|uniref:Uncharacterized protein n=1 Tax=Candidatus Haliotispira prima TaxID=3034016 RepID=A0ABY8MGV4_9SPIO|nr:hypothetical protein P0082_11965 [Candidatus Haliotispira prima]